MSFNVDFLLGHSQRHHAAHLAYGLIKSGSSVKYVTPYYPVGFGKIIASLPFDMGVKAKGFYHSGIPDECVVSPINLQIKKIISKYKAPRYLEGEFDVWLAKCIESGIYRPRVFVSLHDFVPASVEAAKKRGSIIWSDQISNSSPKTHSRIKKHCDLYGVKQSIRSEDANQKILECASIVTYPSKFVLDGLEGRMSENVKAFNIPYGVDVDNFNNGCNNISDEVLHIIGRANNVRKGGHLLLLALKCVGKDIIKIGGFRSIKLTITGELSKELFDLANELSANDWISLDARNFNYLDLPRLFKSAHFFVMPSLAEGMSLMIPEAMASGLPVIATKYCGVDYLIDDVNGVIVEDDVESLSNGLIKMVSKIKLSSRYGDESLAAAKKFDWLSYSNAIASIAKSF